MIGTEASTVIERSVEDTFAYVSDPTNEPQWHTDVIEAQLLTEPPLQTGSRARWVLSFMGRKEQVMEVIRLVPNREITLRGRTIMGLTPTITYALEPDGNWTRFTRRIEMEVSGIGRLFAPMLKTRGAQHNAAFVQNLKRVLETDASQGHREHR